MTIREVAPVDEAHIDALVDDLLDNHPVATTPDEQLRAARFDDGLAFVHFRPGCGGLGADRALQTRVEARFADAGAADWSARNVIGLGMAAPTLHDHGRDDQLALLRPLFTGEHIWCQLFSEPGAGSDLAGLSARAVRDGDEWIVNGEKVWSTLAHVARYGLLLARTDPLATKHAGLSYFVLDMRTPGVDVRPLRQMTGESEFNIVHLQDVRVPASCMIGAPGDGWRVARTTLMNERAALGGGTGDEQRPVDLLLAIYRRAAADGRAAAATRDRVMRRVVASEVARLLEERVAANRPATPGPEGSLSKLAMAAVNQSVFEVALELLGAEATLIDGYPDLRPDAAVVSGGSDPRRAFLRTRANSIEGGSSEILRTLVAERVLGLPPEPRVDKHLPWSQVPRG